MDDEVDGNWMIFFNLSNHSLRVLMVYIHHGYFLWLDLVGVMGRRPGLGEMKIWMTGCHDRK